MAYGVRNENERFFHQKIDFFKIPETLRKCILLYSDRLWGLVSASEWFSTYLHRLWKKSFFRWKKTRFLVRDGLWVQKWEWTFFLSKNRFFSKTMRVGSKSFRGWNKTPKPFRIRWETFPESFRNFEKIDFFMTKKNAHSHFWPHTHSLPNAHFFVKNRFFFKDDEGRFKII